MKELSNSQIARREKTSLSNQKIHTTREIRRKNPNSELGSIGKKKTQKKRKWEKTGKGRLVQHHAQLQIEKKGREVHGRNEKKKGGPQPETKVISGGVPPRVGAKRSCKEGKGQKKNSPLPEEREKVQTKRKNAPLRKKNCPEGQRKGTALGTPKGTKRYERARGEGAPRRGFVRKKIGAVGRRELNRVIKRRS